MLGFIIEIWALAIHHDMLSMAEVLARVPAGLSLSFTFNFWHQETQDTLASLKYSQQAFSGYKTIIVWVADRSFPQTNQ